MSEKDKMMSGLMYNPITDEELAGERLKVKDLCLKYNLLPSSNIVERTELIKKIFGRTKNKIWVESNFYCDYGYNIEAGENFYMNHNCVILDCAKVTFGDNVLVGPNCGFYTALHPIEPDKRILGFEYAKPITIGDNVWIGGGASILAGVNIGSNTVIGAGSVVTKDIPPNVVAFGNPCSIIREINFC